mgnify:CR=1 FL=1
MIRKAVERPAGRSMLIRYPAMKRFRGLIIFAVLIGGCLTSEYVSHRRVDPAGRVTNLTAYLAWRPSAEHFAQVDIHGKPHVIAYGPMSSWVLLSSGPSACVFDDTGRLVDWSADIGDDPQFDEKWNAQRSRGSGRTLSGDQVRKMAATRPAR